MKKLLIFCLVIKASLVFAWDIGTRKPFDAKFFNSSYVATEKCRLYWLKNSVLTFNVSADKKNINIYNNGKLMEQLVNVNLGKNEYNSCFSDGLRGFVVNQAYDNKISTKNTRLTPGFFCTGSAVEFESEINYYFSENNLTIDTAKADYKNAKYERDFDACVLTAVHP